MENVGVCLYCDYVTPIIIQSPLLTSLIALCIFSLFCMVMLGQRYTTPGLDIDRWPDRFFHLLWPVGPVALAVHWPERASDRQFRPQGVRSALARYVNQI